MNFDDSQSELIIEIMSTYLLLVLMIDLCKPIWFKVKNPLHANVSVGVDPSVSIIPDENVARPSCPSSS